MTQARFELDKYTSRVLDVVKGKYGLKNRNEALNKFVKEYGGDLIEPEINENILKEIEEEYNKHIEKNGFKNMQEDELLNEQDDKNI